LSGRHTYVSIPSLLAYELGFAHAAVEPPYHPKFARLVKSQHGQSLFLRAKESLIAEEISIDCAGDGYVPYVVLLFMWFDG
jgi:hypothetical protein